jgi:hypothetical protein
MTNERRKSDKPVLPMKSSNKTGLPVAERMEGRGLEKEYGDTIPIHRHEKEYGDTRLVIMEMTDEQTETR